MLVVVRRSAVHPALAAAIGSALGLSDQLLLAVVAISALPTAQNVLVHALELRRGQALARDAGLIATLLAVSLLGRHGGVGVAVAIPFAPSRP